MDYFNTINWFSPNNTNRCRRCVYVVHVYSAVKINTFGEIAIC